MSLKPIIDDKTIAREMAKRPELEALAKEKGTEVVDGLNQLAQVLKELGDSNLSKTALQAGVDFSQIVNVVGIVDAYKEVGVKKED